MDPSFATIDARNLRLIHRLTDLKRDYFDERHFFVTLVDFVV